MAKANRLKALAYAKVQAVVMGYAGIVGGILYAGIGAVYDAQRGALSSGTALALIAIPVMPIYFAAFGYVSGLIGAFLYNKFSSFLGRVTIDIVRAES